MPNYIKPTFTLTSNKNSVPAGQNPGPLSIALSLSVTDLLSVDETQSQIVEVSNGSPQQLFTGASTMGGPGAGGTKGGFLYLRNVSAASATNVIYVGVDATQDDLGGSGGADAKRLFTLKVGEFAFLPYDYNYNINIDASAAGQQLEYWLFDRGA
tara:strand:+ start:122 stop:586 length:465 start_codon:yes stop_codon:yes gene_type:complete